LFSCQYTFSPHWRCAINLIAAGTGLLGSGLVFRLLEKELPVRALVCPNSTYHPLQAAGAEIAFADLRQPQTILPALSGVERVIAATDGSLTEMIHQPGAGKGRESLRHLVEACKQTGLLQFVLVSGGGLEAPLSPPFSQFTAAEQLLVESGLSCTLLKPAWLAEVWIGYLIGGQLQKDSCIRIAGEGNTPHSFVSIENLIDLAVGVLGHPAAENTLIPLSAPGKFTYRELIALIGDLVSASLEVQPLQPGEALPGVPHEMIEAWRCMDLREDPEWDSREAFSTFGVKPTSLEDSLRLMFSPSKQNYMAVGCE
jgi:uncharacterized protein YbjT (DUF2867 family)